MLRVDCKPSASLLSVIALLAITTAPAPCASSVSPTPILVELFTSEGCSDCPPADRFLRTLDSTQPVAGAQLIVLEEHVDYWDDLGWRDPFSSHVFTLRQQDYVDRMRLASAYTPQMVVDGAYQFVGSDLRSAGKAFQNAGSMAKVGIRISSLKFDNGKLLAHVETDALPSKADVLVALALEHAESQVLRGENGGHHLEHVAILKTLEKIGKPDKGQAFSKDVSLGERLDQPGRLVVFVQEPNQGRVLGAAVQPFKN
jgi:hypothetical protein